jgi:hypothetical protein
MLLHRPETTPMRRQTRKSAIAKLKLVGAPQTAVSGAAPTAAWPQRPDPSVLSESIPLVFISRDSDGFWIARRAESQIGGIFFFQHSALRFAQNCGGPARCATMLLSEPHTFDIENRGNRFVAQLRPARRLLRRLALKLRLISTRVSRAYIEDRMLRAALEVELYRNRYKHSNKNDDDLPIVR